MKNVIFKKIFYCDAPAHGALFAAALMLCGSWCLLSLAVLTTGISLQICGILEGLFFACLLINGFRFGILYRKELSFAKRWKWQLPATGSYLLLLFTSALWILQLPGKGAFYLTILNFVLILWGIFCCAKIISNAANIPYRQLSGKGVWSILFLFTAYMLGVMIYLY